MNDNNNNSSNRESSTLTVRDEDQRLLTPQAQIWQNAPITYVTNGQNYSDGSPVSPGAYYTTIQSTGSRRYGKSQTKFAIQCNLILMAK